MKSKGIVIRFNEFIQCLIIFNMYQASLPLSYKIVTAYEKTNRFATKTFEKTAQIKKYMGIYIPMYFFGELLMCNHSNGFSYYKMNRLCAYIIFKMSGVLIMYYKYDDPYMGYKNSRQTVYYESPNEYGYYYPQKAKRRQDYRNCECRYRNFCPFECPQYPPYPPCPPVCCCPYVPPYPYEQKRGVLTGIQAQLTGSGTAALNSNADILFNSVVNTQSPNITYNPATGTFTITRAGNYYVSWWVATDGTESAQSVYISLRLNGTNEVVSATPSVTGQVNGSALITVKNTPSTLTMVNTGKEPILLADLDVQANIVITEVI